MRIVNDYVMDHMDDLVKSLKHTAEIRNLLEANLGNAHSTFAARCESREDDNDMCTLLEPEAECHWTICPHLHMTELSLDTVPPDCRIRSHHRAGS